MTTDLNNTTQVTDINRYSVKSVKAQVRKAIKDGLLVKQPCVICKRTDVEGHHPDYSKPLDIVWLCRSHHRRLHGAIREKGRKPLNWELSDYPKEIAWRKARRERGSK